jgi:ATP-dependent DNA ligase
LEGIVAKRADSPYRAGRQPTWVKIKNRDYWRREALRFKR